MMVSGEYIVTYELMHDSNTVGHGELSMSIESVTSSEILKKIHQRIDLPDGSNSFKITGIYKL